MAQKALVRAGHTVIPFHPRGGEIDGLEVVTAMSDIEQPVDTVTVYVRPAILETMMGALTQLNPKRVILNPGTEDEGLARELREAGIEVEEACTLVMLNTGQY